MTNRSLLSFFLCIGILVAFTASGVADDDVAKAKKAKGDEKTPAEKVVKKKDASAEEKPGPEDARSKKDKGKAKADKKKPSKKKPGKKKSGGGDSGKKPEPKTEAPESKPADSEKPKPEPPPTVEVKQERFAIEVKLDGTFAAKKGTEIAIDPESWSAYVVLKAVEHGAKVKKGELLIACDTEKIDEALEDARRDFEIADLEFKRTTSEYELLKKLTPMELAEMKRSHAWAKEDESYFWESQLPLEKDMIELSFEFSKFRLEYAKEELRQLEEMYGEDELTEETEEIILKRAPQAGRGGGVHVPDGRSPVRTREVDVASAGTRRAERREQTPRHALPTRGEAFPDGRETARTGNGQGEDCPPEGQGEARRTHRGPKADDAEGTVRRDRLLWGMRPRQVVQRVVDGFQAQAERKAQLEGGPPDDSWRRPDAGRGRFHRETTAGRPRRNQGVGEGRPPIRT